jgi:dihydropteroate synthase
VLVASVDLRPRALRCGGDLLGADHPAVMAILNVTDQSFFDGGRYRAVGTAVARAWEVVREGADVLDIGGESTRPGSQGVSEVEEIGRVVPVIRALREAERPYPIPISVDTSRAEVARQALAAGAQIVNDVSGGRRQPEILNVAADYNASVILMHMRGTPRSMQDDVSYTDLLAEISDFLAESCEAASAAGIPVDAQGIDPGIGFGKDPEGCLEILGNLNAFEGLGRALLIGASRKSFLGKCFDHELSNRLEGSVVAAALAVTQGASMVRVHDVASSRRAVDVAFGIRRAAR